MKSSPAKLTEPKTISFIICRVPYGNHGNLNQPPVAPVVAVVAYARIGCRFALRRVDGKRFLHFPGAARETGLSQNVYSIQK